MFAQNTSVHTTTTHSPCGGGVGGGVVAHEHSHALHGATVSKWMERRVKHLQPHALHHHPWRTTQPRCARQPSAQRTQHAWLQVFVERSHQGCGWWWHTRPRGGWHGVIVARHHQQAPNTTTTLVGQKHKGGVVVHLNCSTARTTTTSIGVSVNSVFHTLLDNQHQQQQQVSTRGVVVLA